MEVEDTAECNGASTDVINANPPSCTWSMATITSTYGYSTGEAVLFKVQALNAIDWSDLSEAGGTAEAEQVPDPMTAATLLIASSDTTNLYLEWTAPTGDATGGDTATITEYQIWSNAGSGLVTDQSTPVATTTDLYYDYTALTPGTVYKIAIVAVNKHGDSDLATAAVFEEVAGGKPLAPAKPSVAISGTNAVISWAHIDVSTSAAAAGYETVTDYRVYINDGEGNLDSDYVEVEDICEFDSDAGTPTYSCTFSLDKLQESPLGLDQHDIIKAQIIAHNERGWSDRSPESDDVVYA